ncbi:protein-L-isoaspartate O-methyltransferase [Paracoccaceae bacterium]|nr:protein-L-isoaspartate O-methyltransferase [Paracoccaceae bacterium]
MNHFEKLRKTMVDTQVRPSGVSCTEVINALANVPRELFVPEYLKNLSYIEENIVFESGRFMVQPRILGKLLENLLIQKDESVLVVGSGCGYMASVVGKLAELVVGVESDKVLIESAEQSVIEAGIDNVIIVESELSLGATQHGLYDVIIFEGAIDLVPDIILSQLKEYGRIAAFFSERNLTEARVGVKVNGILSWRSCFSCDVPVMKEFRKLKTFSL